MSDPLEWRGPQSHVTSDGKPKRFFETRDQARKEMRRQELQIGVHLRVYKCAHCPGYHIGNLPQHMMIGVEDDG